MTALSDAYSGTVADQRGRGRLYLGVGLFGVGAILVVAGIVAAGSGVLTAQGYSLGEARWLAGVLGGVGVPAVFLGIFTILPAGRTTRGAALIGANLKMGHIEVGQVGRDIQFSVVSSITALVDQVCFGKYRAI